MMCILIPTKRLPARRHVLEVAVKDAPCLLELYYHRCCVWVGIGIANAPSVLLLVVCVAVAPIAVFTS
eukprot:1087873-Lingulodinium_polyedra.AAC.1